MEQTQEATPPQRSAEVRRGRAGKAARLAVAVAVAAGLVLARTPAARAHRFSVHSPIVEQGEWELELITTHEWSAGTKPGDGALVGFAIGYGMNDRWFSELEFSWHRAPGSPLRYATTEWENVIQLTEQGRYWLDWGLFAEVEIAAEEGAPHEVELGPLMEKDVGDTRNTLNLLLEREFGDNAEQETEFEGRWQTRWLLGPAFEPGFAAFVAERQARVGPMVQGKAGLFAYEAGYFAGLTDETPDHTLTAVLELEF